MTTMQDIARLAGALGMTSSVSRVPMYSLINGSGHSRRNLVVTLLDRIIVRIGLAI